MKPQKPHKEKNSTLKNVALLSGIAFEMGAIIYLAAQGGIWLDEKYQNEKRIYTAIATIIGVAISLWVVLRQIKNVKYWLGEPTTLMQTYNVSNSKNKFQIPKKENTASTGNLGPKRLYIAFILKISIFGSGSSKIKSHTNAQTKSRHSLSPYFSRRARG